MKKLFSIVLIIILLLSSMLIGIALTEDGDDEILFLEDLLHDEGFIVSMREYLLSRYGEEYWNNLEQARANDEKLMSLFPRSISGEIVYPDFIGGIYYNEDGNMVLQIVDDSTLSRAMSDQYNLVMSQLEDLTGIVIEYVQFSYNELNSTMDILNDMFLGNNRPVAFDNVDSFALDTVNNRVEVRLRIYNEEKIIQFRSTVIDLPIIVFVESHGSIDFLTELIEQNDSIC